MMMLLSSAASEDYTSISAGRQEPLWMNEANPSGRPTVTGGNAADPAL
jgi:hypothetical protein